MFKRIVKTLMVVSALFSFSVAAADKDNPYDIIHEVGDKTFKRLQVEHDKVVADPNYLRTIMTEDLMPYVDYQYAGLKVLGRYLSDVPRDKVPEYLKEFRMYLINTFAAVLAQYDNQKVVYEPVSDVDGDSNVTVRVLIQEPGRPDIKIAFKLRKNPKTDEWLTYDMVAEGNSLLSAKRSELESVLRTDGIDKVIDILKQKNAEPLTLPEKKF